MRFHPFRFTFVWACGHRTVGIRKSWNGCPYCKGKR